MDWLDTDNHLSHFYLQLFSEHFHISTKYLSSTSVTEDGKHNSQGFTDGTGILKDRIYLLLLFVLIEWFGVYGDVMIINKSHGSLSFGPFIQPLLTGGASVHSILEQQFPIKHIPWVNVWVNSLLGSSSGVSGSFYSFIKYRNGISSGFMIHKNLRGRIYGACPLNGWVWKLPFIKFSSVLWIL